MCAGLTLACDQEFQTGGKECPALQHSCTFLKKRQKKTQNKKIHLIKFTQRTKCTAKAFKVNGKGMLWVLFVAGVAGFFFLFRCTSNELVSLYRKCDTACRVTSTTDVLIKAVHISRHVRCVSVIPGTGPCQSSCPAFVSCVCVRVTSSGA